MIDPKYIREHAEEVRTNVLRRCAHADVDAFIAVEKQRSELIRDIETLRATRNEIAEQMKSVTDSSERETWIEKGKALKVEIAEKETAMEPVQSQWELMLPLFPNQTHPDVPIGDSDEQNVEVRRVGEVPSRTFQQKHAELPAAKAGLDFERGIKVTGAKFYFLKGKLALLEQALIRYGIDFAMREGFEFLTTPDLAKEEVLVAKGFLPRGPEKQVYYIEGENLALVGTAEIPVLGYHMDETIPVNELPKKYVAFSHCFRTEAGAYGRESYGLYRVHQFAKVEMFGFTHPDQSLAMHQEFLRIEESFWKSLEIPFRVVDCCTGDLGGSDYRRYDIEAWMWGKGETGGWGEVTSCSNCLDYQARGLDIKYSDSENHKGLVHTLNGTVVATPRAMIAILENHQQPDGSVRIPDVLIPYCGFEVM